MLFQHRESNPIPRGGERAWSVFHLLSGAAVSRFGLQQQAIEAVAGELDGDAMRELLEQLSEISAGLDTAREEK